MAAFGIDVKRLLAERIAGRVLSYEKKPDIATRYEAPLIGYVSAENPMFDEFHLREMTTHPKRVFRPGNTVIAYFIPFANHIAESNRGGASVSPAWSRAVSESVMLCAHVNGVMRGTFDEIGYYETSGANSPGDWAEEICRPRWSHKHAAFLAGLGDFGAAGALYTSAGFAGCFGSVITAYRLEPSREWTEDELSGKEALCGAIEKAILSAPDYKIPLCPVGAITAKGVNRAVCAEFCKKQDQPAPLPEVCGKCFFEE